MLDVATAHEKEKSIFVCQKIKQSRERAHDSCKGSANIAHREINEKDCGSCRLLCICPLDPQYRPMNRVHYQTIIVRLLDALRVDQHQWPNVQGSRQYGTGIVAVAMQDKRGHGSAMQALRYECARLQIVRIINDKPVDEQRMCLYRHSIQKCSNGLDSCHVCSGLDPFQGTIGQSLDVLGITQHTLLQDAENMTSIGQRQFLRPGSSIRFCT